MCLGWYISGGSRFAVIYKFGKVFKTSCRRERRIRALRNERCCLPIPRSYWWMNSQNEKCESLPMFYHGTVKATLSQVRKIECFTDTKIDGVEPNVSLKTRFKKFSEIVSGKEQSFKYQENFIKITTVLLEIIKIKVMKIDNIFKRLFCYYLIWILCLHNTLVSQLIIKFLRGNALFRNNINCWIIIVRKIRAYIF